MGGLARVVQEPLPGDGGHEPERHDAGPAPETDGRDAASHQPNLRRRTTLPNDPRRIGQADGFERLPSHAHESASEQTSKYAFISFF